MAPFGAMSGKTAYRKVEPSDDNLPIFVPPEEAARLIYPTRTPENHGGKTNGKRKRGKRRKGWKKAYCSLQDLG